MPNEIPPVETPAQSAGSEQKPEDWELKYKEQAERLVKAEEAARNYKTAALKYKKAVKEEEAEEPLDADERLRQIAREELANSRVEQERKKLEDLNLQMAHELKEAKLALNNKANMSTASMGSGEGNNMPDVKTDFWSAEQIAELKKRGLTDEQIKKAANHAQASSQYPLR